MRTIPALGALVGLAVCVGCRHPAPPPPPNVLLVVVDTLRADRLGCYGNHDGLTPFLDSLAARGHLFRRAYAASSWTNPSVASLMTSRYQSQHGVIAFNSVLSDDEVTVAEALHAAGYTTGGFSANGLIGPLLGYGQGFDVYRAHWVQPDEDRPRYLWMPARADVINAEAVAWIERLWQHGPPAMPVLLYVQYMEPHTPYAPPEAFLDRALHGRPRPDLDDLNGLAFVGHLEDVPDDTLADIRAVYDAEVMAVDAAIRDLFAALAARGFLDRALVVVTADHGEELKDHGLMGHDKTLYEEVIHVPLIVLTPGETRGAVSDAIVSLVDVAPTLVDAVPAEIPERFAGKSLRDELAAADGVGTRLRRLFGRARASGTERAAYSELVKTPEEDATRIRPHERAIVVGERKLIVGVHGEREFYRLDVDPGERHAASEAGPDGAALESRMATLRAETATVRTRADRVPLDDQTRERLRALGYAN
jgi:arylsulfatase A-like enzyme